MTHEEFIESNVERIPESGCWLWMGRVNKLGYGQLSFNAERASAHRFSYKYLVGPIGAGLCVCHRCDTPGCVNPSHLFLGTNYDNAMDMVKKGRNKSALNRGDGNGNKKLTLQDVRTIRHLFYAERRKAKEIAAFFGLNVWHAYQIISKRYWRPV